MLSGQIACPAFSAAKSRMRRSFDKSFCCIVSLPSQLVESLKLLAAALRHKPGSPAAEEALEAGRLDKVLRGIAAALQRPVGKAKRRVEALKTAASSVEAVARLCGSPGAQLPPGGLKALKEALQAAASAEVEEGAAGKVKGQLTRIEGAVNRAVAAAAGGGGGASGKKEQKKRKEGPAAGGAGAAQEKKAKGGAAAAKKGDGEPKRAGKGAKVGSKK